MKMISDHFSYNEMTATTKKLLNIPKFNDEVNLIHLCHDVLELVRALLGVPMIISSGFRCEAVNDAVGGADHSPHLDGLAADFCPNGVRLNDAYILIKSSKIPFDTLILEPGWLHISASKGVPRRKAWIA